VVTDSKLSFHGKEVIGAQRVVNVVGPDHPDLSAGEQLARTQKKYWVCGVNPVSEVVNTPAAVDPLGVVPAVGAVLVVPKKNSYPSAGITVGAVHVNVAPFAVTPFAVAKPGGVQLGAATTLKAKSTNSPRVTFPQGFAGALTLKSTRTRMR
jgi:hypothetical protein